MIRRGLAFSLFVGLASAAQAGVVVELEATSADRFQPCGQFDSGEVVTVEVFLRRDATVLDDKPLRLVQLDFTLTSPELTLPVTVSWEPPVDVDYHHVEDAIAGIRPNLVAFAHSGPRSPPLPMGPAGPADLQGDPGFQLVLPGDMTQRVKVGEIVVTMSLIPPLSIATDVFTLDTVNAAGAGPNNGAVVSFGYGVDPGDDITIWRAGTADLSGGTLTMAVTNAPINFAMPSDSDNPSPPANPPAERMHLSRTKGTIIEIIMNMNAVDPGPGDISIKELLPGGGFGPELEPNFFTDIQLFGVNNRRLVLIDQSVAGVIENGKWYRVSNSGTWTGAAAFEVDYAVNHGDVNAGGLTDVLDANEILGNRGDTSANSRFDVNGNGLVDVLDANVALGLRGSLLPAKPNGHSCP